MDKKYDVFISYSRKDLEMVKEVKAKIDRLVSIDCWMDLDGIESGEQFEDVIINAICKCDAIFFMMAARGVNKSSGSNNIVDVTSVSCQIVDASTSGCVLS